MSDYYLGTLCPECGPCVAVDEEGLCRMCGLTAVGTGIDKVLRRRDGAQKCIAHALNLLGVNRESPYDMRLDASMAIRWLRNADDILRGDSDALAHEVTEEKSST